LDGGILSGGTYNGTVSATGSSQINGSTVTLNGSFVVTGGTMTVNPGSPVLGSGGITMESGATMVNASSSLNKTHTIRGTLNSSATISQPLNLQAGTITSASTLTVSSTLNVNHSSVGTSQLIAGTLSVSGATTISNLNTLSIQASTTLSGAGALTVNTGGVLQVNGLVSKVSTVNGRLTGAGTVQGTVASAVNISPNGTLAPGNSPGQITISGGLEIGGTLEMDIHQGGSNYSNGPSGPSLPGTGFDTIRVQPPPTNPTATTNATIRTSSFQVRLLTANTSQSAFESDNFWDGIRRWAMVQSTTGTIQLRDASNNLQTSPLLITSQVQLFNPEGTIPLNFQTLYPNGSFYLDVKAADYSGYQNQLDLIWNPVPGPATILGFAVGVGVLVSRVRRRWVGGIT
jgi:hypothetical protein